MNTQRSEGAKWDKLYVKADYFYTSVGKICGQAIILGVFLIFFCFLQKKG